MILPPNESESDASTGQPLAFFNGAFVPFAEARLPLYDAGVVLGATVTDFVRTFRCQLYRLQDHLERFFTSCDLVDIPLVWNQTTLAPLAEELVSRNAQLLNAGQELALILIATPGEIPFYAGDLLSTARSTLAMHTARLDMRRNAAYFQSGIGLATPQIRAIPKICIDPRIKHRSRLHWQMASNEVNRVRPRTIALLLDTEGFITETAAANFLLVRAGKVLSPPLDTVLNGVSLAIVRELCAEIGIDFQERPLTLQDCADAQEAFLTNTSFCLAGVRRINDIELTWPGPVSERILNAWSQKLGVDIRQQFLQNL